MHNVEHRVKVLVHDNIVLLLLESCVLFYRVLQFELNQNHKSKIKEEEVYF
jgi:hypothetical protein